MESTSSLGLFGIIREAFKNISKNRKLVISILLLVFLISCQTDFAEKYLLAPFAKDLSSQFEKYPNMIQDIANGMDLRFYAAAIDDVREMLLVKISIWVITSIISIVYLVAVISSSSEAYTAKLLGPKDIFLKLRKSWKRPLVTNFCMIFLTLGIVFFYFIVITIAAIFASNTYALVFLGVVTLTTPICYFYLGALWKLSLIVSVLEEGSSGLKAVGRAAELIKGKRVQASLLMVLFAIAYGLVAMMTRFLTSYNRGLASELAFTIPLKNLCFCLMKLFMLVAFTVFYHERKTSQDEQKEEGNRFYLPIASGDEV
uniref:uncharacterized protein LOC122601060 n=1 Tax=Erigeron canadensis TaxID=72917 RepID=UPI001CB971B1|nr:uncharacterized protein LOC122601060 [Erigeron canadensis]